MSAIDQHPRHPDDLDADQLMERIRENVRARREARAHGVPPRAGGTAAATDASGPSPSEVVPLAVATGHRLLRPLRTLAARLARGLLRPVVLEQAHLLRQHAGEVARQVAALRLAQDELRDEVLAHQAAAAAELRAELAARLARIEERLAARLDPHR